LLAWHSNEKEERKREERKKTDIGERGGKKGTL
jgi:hypothetical protein